MLVVRLCTPFFYYGCIRKAAKLMCIKAQQGPHKHKREPVACKDTVPLNLVSNFDHPLMQCLIVGISGILAPLIWPKYLYNDLYDMDSTRLALQDIYSPLAPQTLLELIMF